ncbi:putative C6 transcription factor [Aspergillus novofumigatus IBT 16806]|uniref:Putative fungal-specific transcription factor n=1 Tax=Aspergillus novofumigatus (strain IBT 16806) TaxID=1392255 RepID=A0A2I1BVG8_ASPN1|nr:putative fungal-specific transcription factor [Aspergillus novofumigatus IBT 16806]PKX89364.1 putative fungal-specific transcription factor [Aspergillus novofumigatus IBT 16806]
MTRSTDEGNFKSYSCLTCRQRKVKCDRRVPCCNCVKVNKQCSFIPPVRGKRKRTKPPREGLHAKLERYEKLLSLHGIKSEPSDAVDDSDSETDVCVDEDANVVDTPQSTLEETKPKLIIREGVSRYFDSAPWSIFGGEFQHPEVGGHVDESFSDENGLFFGQNEKVENLASLHPSVQILPKLRDIYADRVDPLVKILHLPTLSATLENALRHPAERSRSLEAIMFAFYLAVVGTLNEVECQDLFGLSKSVMYSRYRVATRQALINARFLSSSSPMTLQAYVLFMMCVRKSYSCDTLFVLSGVAIRLARKMGLHRDGSFLGLSPFDAEMRRRLWWHLVHVDFRVADVLGTRPSMDITCADTKTPLNVDDEDLHPDMTDLPPERNGITPISLCLIRHEIMVSLHDFSTSSPADMRWEVLLGPKVPPARKDHIISQIEDHLERKYLRYCDPANPLHTFVSIMIRFSICKMKLVAHNPRQFASCPPKDLQRERDIVFANATKLLEYVTLVQGGHRGLEKYTWQIGTSALWNAMLYMLIEIRHRRTGPEVDRSWQLIGVVFSCPRIFGRTPAPVDTVLRKWTLEVWNYYVAASKAEGLPEPSTPEYINEICGRIRSTGNPSRTEHASADRGPVVGSLPGCNQIQTNGYESLPDFGSLDSYEFPDILSFEMDSNEWVQWEQLVAEGGRS